MRFGFQCRSGHEIILDFSIGQAPSALFCSAHDEPAARVFDVPYVQEDRLHMAARTPNAPQEDWSWAIGGPRPKSRSERRIIEKTLGIEFVTPAEAKADARALREGKNLSVVPKPEKGYLAREVAKRGIRFDRSLSPPRSLTREEAERKLEAQTGWSSTAEAEAKGTTIENLSS